MKNKLKSNEAVVTALIAAIILFIFAISSFVIGPYVGIDRINHDIPESIGFAFSLGFLFLPFFSAVLAIFFAVYHRNNNPRRAEN
jgi:hypothetical protein